jgi:hypothetical protein
VRKTFIVTLIMVCLIGITTTTATAAKITIISRPTCAGSGLGEMAVFRIEVKKGDTLKKIADQLNGKTWTIKGPIGTRKVDIPKDLVTPEMLRDDAYQVLGGTIDNLKPDMIIEFPVPIPD